MNWQLLLKKPVNSVLLFLLFLSPIQLIGQGFIPESIIDTPRAQGTIASFKINEEPHIEKRFLNPPAGSVELEHSKECCTNLIQHILPSPDQQNAGSCLYMALTSISEMALSIKHPRGKIDLSERYAMNLGQKLLPEIKNWRTDMINIFNINGGSALNENYRFTKGWYFPDDTDGTGPNGSPSQALVNAPGARRGTYYNWTTGSVFNSLPRVSLPTFKRKILFETANQSPFATGLHKLEMVQRVKDWLYEHDRPLLVIYNHFGYWHAVVIAGFDDNRSSNGWFTDKFIDYMEQRASFYDTYNEPEKAARYRKWVADVISNRKEEGGASTGKGVFFVRDSIYPDPEATQYDYVLNETGDESPLTHTYIEHDYTWLLHLANHIVAIDF